MSSSPPRVAIVATSATPTYEAYPDSEVTLIMECVNDVITTTGMDRHDIGFTIAGSCDYLSGMPFAFVSNVDGMGAWPPVYESHLEMDAAWALWEAWIRLQLGDISTALVVGSGKSSPGDHRESFALQTDPYTMAPLGLDPTSLDALQAQALVQAGLATEEDFAEVVARSYAAAGRSTTTDELLAAPHVSAPLRAHDIAPVADGAAAVILATEEVANDLSDHPVWIENVDHRMDTHHVQRRDLTDSPSTRIAAEAIGLGADRVDVAELHVTASSHEIILRRALGLNGSTSVNPSGGPLVADPVMCTGLRRIIEVADRIAGGEAQHGLAHAASGACLQQNLLCLLKGGE